MNESSLHKSQNNINIFKDLVFNLILHITIVVYMMPKQMGPGKNISGKKFLGIHFINIIHVQSTRNTSEHSWTQLF